jgi:glycine betaine/proline transport system substrate-binding protein
MHFPKKSSKAWLLVALALAVIVVGLGACSSSDDAADKAVIKFADNQFESIWINNAIIQYIMEEGYGYETESIEMSTVIAQTALQSGQVDVWLELWQQNMPVWYEEEIGKGTIENLGAMYEQGPQFYIIPMWVHEQYNIDTIEDMKANWELFKDPEDPSKGAFINCPLGWQCETVNAIKLEAYGLLDTFNIVNPGSSGALDAALKGPQVKGDPVFGYYWAPTNLYGLYDWYILEEPVYDPAVWAKVGAAQEDASLRPIDEACAYENLPVDIGIHAEFRSTAPELVAMLEKASTGFDNLNETAAWGSTEEIAGEWRLAAVHFLETYESLWKNWVTSDAFTKIKAALAKE